MDVSVTQTNPIKRIFTGRRGRDLRENLTAYLMISPAMLLIFVFGIFPVGFALFVSLHNWKLKRGDFIGLQNYIDNIDNFMYVGLFALGIGALVGAFLILRRIWAQAEEKGQRIWAFAVPGSLYAATAFLFIYWAFLQLPEILDIADKIVGVEKTRELFMQLLGEAFRAESVLPTTRLFLGVFAAAVVVGIASYNLWRKPENPVLQSRFGLAWLSLGTGAFLLWTTYNSITQAYTAALETGEEPEIWTQVITISAGVILLVIAWFVWRSAANQYSNRSFWLRVIGASVLLVGGWLLVAEIPAVVAAGDKDLWQGLKVTVFYSLGTVPFQLAFALFLAILLFQKMRGSEAFRIIFFLPYVTPTVASAAVFRQLFSNRLQAPANALLRWLGLEGQQWLREPDGIFEMIGRGLGVTLPDWAGGPSMALLVIMVYSIWTYVGYDVVIYLAGLGNIPTELVEAAEIDGAGRWQVFRNITFPLLSPTTYFLSLLAIIGTFKAFTHIWVLSLGESLGTTNTFSVTIFIEFYEKLRYGYASAMAFVLFAIILCLTLINNKIQGSRVFYG